MMRRASVAAVLFGELPVCSHAVVVKHGRHLTAGTDSDAEALDWKEVDEDTIQKAMLSPQINQHIIADLDSDRMELVTGTGEDSELDGSINEGVIADGEGKSGTTLSPAARQAAFFKEFEKNFTIQLNMTYAHATGMSLGLELEFEVDYQPAKIIRVRKTGLVEEWNLANPGMDVHVGDQIVQVNHIEWHHNTEDFVKRISGQFKAGRKLTPGADEMLTLLVQRPRKKPHEGKRYPLQREDAHHKKYPVEFEAEIHLPLGGVDMTASEYQVMGWQLYSEHDWDPISIVNLTGGGVIGAYNKANPDHAILSGDELVKIDEVPWHHSAAAFRTRVWQKFELFRKQLAGAETMVLSIRRPAAVYAAAVAAKEASLAGAQDHLDSVQSSVAPEPPLKTSGTTLSPFDDSILSEQRSALLDERIRAAADKVDSLNADRAEIANKISELVHKKMNISSELAAAEEAQAELEAERQHTAPGAPPKGPPKPRPDGGDGQFARGTPARSGATAEEAQMELEAERQQTARGTPPPGPAHPEPDGDDDQTARETPPPGPAHPEPEGDDDDVIGGYEDEDK